MKDSRKRPFCQPWRPVVGWPHMSRAYLDHAASTPLDPRAAEAVVRALAVAGNPSSVHAEGRAARALIETAREQVAALVAAPASSVVLTSGATEANAIAIRGAFAFAARRAPGRRLRLLASPVEHSSVMDALQVLERDHDAEIVMLPVDDDGVVRIEGVPAFLNDDVAVVAVMYANNVTGVLQPVEAIGALVAAERTRRGKDALPLVFICDAVQAARTEALRPFKSGIDVLTLSSHKIHGPKGVGALIRRPGVILEPLVAAGGQEDGLRGGTENVAAIAGFGAAAELLVGEMKNDALAASALRGAFLNRLASASQGRIRPAVSAPTVPGIVYVVGHGLGEEAVMRLDSQGFAVSAGSACDAGKRRASHVLAAMRGGREGGVRVSFGRGTRQEELVALADALAAFR